MFTKQAAESPYGTKKNQTVDFILIFISFVIIHGQMILDRRSMTLDQLHLGAKVEQIRYIQLYAASMKTIVAHTGGIHNKNRPDLLSVFLKKLLHVKARMH